MKNDDFATQSKVHLVLDFAMAACLGLAIVALSLSWNFNPSSRIQSNISITAFLESCWTIIVVGLIIWNRRAPRELTRTVQWVFGFWGFIVAVSIFAVPAIFEFFGHHAVPLSSRREWTFVLATIVWGIGICWSVESVVLGIRAGDWHRTIWAKLIQRRRGKY